MTAWVLRISLCLPVGCSSAWAAGEQLPGPTGVHVIHMSANSSNGCVFAIANRMPYRSTDNGVTWAPIYNNLDGNFNGFEIISSGRSTKERPFIQF